MVCMASFLSSIGRIISHFDNIRLKCFSKVSQSPFPRPMVHRAAPISVSIALGHASANAVKATAGGLVHW